MKIAAIVLENSVFVCTYHPNCHDYRIVSLNHLNIRDTEKDRSLKFVGCWLGVKGSVFEALKNIETAKLYIKQDERPPWFNKKDARARVKEAFKKWHNEHVLIDQEIDELSSGHYYLKNCKVECLSRSVEIEVCHNCRIDIMVDKALIRWCCHSVIGEMYDKSEIWFGNETVVVKSMHDNSDIEDSNIKLHYDFRDKKES